MTGLLRAKWQDGDFAGQVEVTKPDTPIGRQKRREIQIIGCAFFIWNNTLAVDIDALYQTNEITASPVVAYPINVTTPGTYTLWLRGYPANAAGDSVYVGLGDEQVEVTGFAPGVWSWANTTSGGVTAILSITTTGVQTVSLAMREDGVRIDRLLLTTDTTYIPTDDGPTETDRQLGSGPLIVPITRTIVYTYDPLYRLTEADYTSGENYQYSYDRVGNRLAQVINGDTTDYLYDAANRLFQVDGQSYTFDDNGNLLQTGVMTNSWDAANRLVESSRDGATLEPIYNGVNDRVGQTVGVTTTYFALDVMGLPEVIYTTEGNLYLHLPGVMMAESGTGDVRYLLSDGLGSVRQATDESGEVVAYNEFDPYGNPVQSYSSPYGFTGEWWERDIGLLHLRARWYAPETGTFLSVDPVESEPPYQYVRGNVVNRTDSSGLFSEFAVKSSISPEVFSNVQVKRQGLYELLLDAKDGQVIKPLWITINPFHVNLLNYDYTPAHPVPHTTAILECKGARIEAYITSQHRSSRIRMSLDDYIQYLDEVEVTDIEEVYQRGGNSEALESVWAKPTFTHYYVLSEPNDAAKLNEQNKYYRDISGSNLLPDVIARGFEGSLSFDGQSLGIGVWQLIDKHGQVYFADEGGYGPDLPAVSSTVGTYREGFVDPRSAGNTAVSIKEAILNRKISWGTEQSADILGYNAAEVGDVYGGYDWGIQGWFFLDGELDFATVAETPDNGCNCGG